MVYDLKWFETQIVRVAERNPEHVGARNVLRDASGNMCILGKIIFDATGDVANHTVHQQLWMASPNLMQRLCALNNSGMKWGEIPKALRLVPGEQPASEPVAEPEMAVVR